MQDMQVEVKNKEELRRLLNSLKDQVILNVSFGEKEKTNGDDRKK